jgi:hypothetical protein
MWVALAATAAAITLIGVTVAVASLGSPDSVGMPISTSTITDTFSDTTDTFSDTTDTFSDTTDTISDTTDESTFTTTDEPDSEPPPPEVQARVFELAENQFYVDCPSTLDISFEGEIEVSDSADVTFMWIDSGGWSSDEIPIQFDGAGTESVTFSRSLDVEQDATGWVAIMLLSPVEGESERVYFDTYCAPVSDPESPVSPTS